MYFVCRREQSGRSKVSFCCHCEKYSTKKKDSVIPNNIKIETRVKMKNKKRDQ